MGYIGNPLDPWGAAEESIAYRASLRGDGGLGRLRRARGRPRQPVPRPAQRGRRRPRPSAGRSIDATAEPARAAARLRLADVERRQRAGQGVPRRSTAACRCSRGRSRRSRRSRGSRAGSARRARRARVRPAAARLAGARGRPPSRGAPTPCSTRLRARSPAGGARVALSERESLERLAAAGLPVTPWRAVAAEPDAAVGGLAGPRRRTGRGQAGRRRASPTRARPAACASGWPTRPRSARRSPELVAAAAARAGVEPPRPARRADGRARGRADRGRPARRRCSGRRCWSGSGGILAEVLDDVAVMLAPVSAAEVRRPSARPPRGGAPARRPRAARASTSTRSPRWSRGRRLLVGGPGDRSRSTSTR